MAQSISARDASTRRVANAIDHWARDASTRRAHKRECTFDWVCNILLGEYNSGIDEQIYKATLGTLIWFETMLLKD